MAAAQEMSTETEMDDDTTVAAVIGYNTDDLPADVSDEVFAVPQTTQSYGSTTPSRSTERGTSASAACSSDSVIIIDDDDDNDDDLIPATDNDSADDSVSSDSGCGKSPAPPRPKQLTPVDVGPTKKSYAVARMLGLQSPTWSTLFKGKTAARDARGRRQPRYRCDVCNQLIVRHSSLVKHIRTHLGTQLYRCDVCRIGFNSGRRLSLHEAEHAAEEKKTARNKDENVAASSTAGKLAVRRRRVGEKRHVHRECGEESATSGHLTSHMHHRHTDGTEKLYLCETCGKEFADCSNFVKHRRSHTGETPHKCDLCVRQFGHPSDVTKHRRIHTGERPYSCNLCDHKFRQSCHLRLHRRCVHLCLD